MYKSARFLGLTYTYLSTDAAELGMIFIFLRNLKKNTL
jgi:hypothetical protein